jgi:hypothetical protein
MRVPAQQHLFNKVSLFTGIHAYRLLNILDLNAGLAAHIRSLCVFEGDGTKVCCIGELLVCVHLSRYQDEDWAMDALTKLGQLLTRVSHLMLSGMIWIGLPSHSLAVLSSHFCHITQLTIADSDFDSSTTCDALCKSFPYLHELDIQSVRWGPGGGWNTGPCTLHRLVLAESHSTALVPWLKQKGSLDHLGTLSLLVSQEDYISDGSWQGLLVTVAPSLQRLRFVIRGYTLQLKSLGKTASMTMISSPLTLRLTIRLSGGRQQLVSSSLDASVRRAGRDGRGQAHPLDIEFTLCYPPRIVGFPYIHDHLSPHSQPG